MDLPSPSGGAKNLSLQHQVFNTFPWDLEMLIHRKPCFVPVIRLREKKIATVIMPSTKKNVKKKRKK